MQVLSFIWDPSPGIDLGFFMIRYYSLMFVIAFTIGWFLTKNVMAKFEYVTQKHDGYSNTSIFDGGKFDGVMLETVISF